MDLIRKPIRFPVVMITKFVKKGYTHYFFIFYFKWISSFIIVKLIKNLILWSLRWVFSRCRLTYDQIFEILIQAQLFRSTYPTHYTHFRILTCIQNAFNVFEYSHVFKMFSMFKTIWTFFFQKRYYIHISNGPGFGSNRTEPLSDSLMVYKFQNN